MPVPYHICIVGNKLYLVLKRLLNILEAVRPKQIFYYVVMVRGPRVITLEMLLRIDTIAAHALVLGRSSRTCMMFMRNIQYWLCEDPSVERSFNRISIHRLKLRGYSGPPRHLRLRTGPPNLFVPRNPQHDPSPQSDGCELAQRLDQLLLLVFARLQ